MVEENIEKVGYHIGRTVAQVKIEAKKKASIAISAAFAFVIALVWRDAIKEAIDKILENLGMTGSAYIYNIIAAVIVTVICVIGIMFISRWGEAEKK